jgi:hypothetical protein
MMLGDWTRRGWQSRRITQQQVWLVVEGIRAVAAVLLKEGLAVAATGALVLLLVVLLVEVWCSGSSPGPGELMGS